MFGGRCPGEGQVTERGATARETNNLFWPHFDWDAVYLFCTVFVYIGGPRIFGGVTGNPSERSERASRGSGLTGE